MMSQGHNFSLLQLTKNYSFDTPLTYPIWLHGSGTLPDKMRQCIIEFDNKTVENSSSII